MPLRAVPVISTCCVAALGFVGGKLHDDGGIKFPRLQTSQASTDTKSVSNHSAVILVPAKLRDQKQTRHLVFHCMDLRIQPTLDRWNDGLDTLPDRIVRAGVTAALKDPKERESVFKEIDLAIRLHQVSDLWMINHRDCGGHGGSGKHPSSEAEMRYHQKELNEGLQILKKRFPTLKVHTYFADFAARTP